MATLQTGISQATGQNAELMGVLIEHLDSQARQMTRAVEKTSAALDKIDARLFALEKSMSRSYPMRIAEFVFFIADGAQRKKKGLFISLFSITIAGAIVLFFAHLWPDFAPILDTIKDVKK